MYDTDVKMIVRVNASNPKQALENIIDTLDVAGGIVQEHPSANDNEYTVQLPSGDSSEFADIFEEKFQQRSDVNSGTVLDY